MTDEQRLDRLERIVKLMIKAGLRARQQSREQDEKINILIDMQMKNDERYEKRFAENAKRVRKNEEALAALAAKTDERLAVQSAKTDEKLAALAAKTDETLAAFASNVDASLAVVAAAQASVEEQLKSFMATVERILTERRNGNP